MRQASREQGSGVVVAKRLRERREEIEGAILTRIYAVSEPPATGGPEYAEGLRAAASAALDYGIEGIERGEQSSPAVPDVLISQARLAARSGVSLDTVLRRYFAGYTLLEDFMAQEAEREIGPAALKRLLRSQASIVDRLLAAVSGAYAEEAGRKPQGAERRKAELVERLVAGESLSASGLGYELEGRHLGIVASGQGALEQIGAFAKALDSRLLAVQREEGILWAWLGSRRGLDPGEILERLPPDLPPGIALAIGEPGEGIVGWRLTHCQARAALAVALRSEQTLVRYADVALLASALQDDLLLASLRHLYVQPLEQERDEGAVARETLLAYFANSRSVSTTAAVLGVARQTVTKRLHAIESRIGRPLVTCGTEMEVALRLEQMTFRPVVAPRG